MRKIVAVLGLLLFFSCEKEETSHPISSTIQIQTNELAIGNEKRIFLSCATEKIYACSNFNIITSQQAQPNLFQVHFSGIDNIKHCATAIGPARAEIELGALKNGEYLLELNAKAFRNSGKIKITDSEIILSFPHQQGIAIMNPVYKR